MAGDRATNIKVRIDIKDAMGKITQLKSGMQQVGAQGQKSGQQIQQGMNQASGAMNNAGNVATTNAVKFQTMGQGMLNLSTAAVQTYTSISNLARAENRAEAASLGLQRAEDLLARKKLAYNKIVEAGNKNSREAKLIMDEITTATNDLAVKTDKLKIEQEAVTDVYLLFAANIANVGVSSLLIYKSTMEGVTKASAISSIVTAKNTIITKLNTLAKWNSSKSFLGVAAASATATGGLVASTAATKAATLATKLLNFALGPVGLIIIGITAALTAYETNFLGFKDGINSFLGIQEEFNEGVDDGTLAIDAQTEALGAQKTAFDKLSTPMKNYITLQEEFARSTNNASELLRLAQFRGASGFSSGVGSTQIIGQQGIVSNGSSNVSTTGNTAFDSANNIEQQGTGFGDNGFLPSAYGAEQELTNVVQSRKPTLSSDHGKNPFGTLDQKIAFYEQTYSGQRDTLLAWIDNTWDSPGTQSAYIKKYWEIFDISNGFTDQKSEAMNPVDEFKNIMSSGKEFTGMPKKGFFAAGFGGNGSIFDFKLDNRAMIKDALGVDIGAIANTITTHEAIQIANIQKSLGRFTDQGGKTRELLHEIRNLGGVNSNGQTSATALYQGVTVKASQAFYDRIREQDYQQNSGNNSLRSSAGSIFEGGGLAGISANKFGRHAFRFSSQYSMFRETTGQIAGQFGSDQIARDELAAASDSLLTGEHGRTQIRALMFAIEAGKIADRRIDRVESTISTQLGIDFNANSGEGYYYKVGGSKNRPITGFVSTARPFWEVIREDIGADGSIKLPSIMRMEAISLAFEEYGSSWTNFNNLTVHKNAGIKLGLTEQKIFDIRFDQTRGDRELLNRLRYVEKIEASSSGTAPI